MRKTLWIMMFCLAGPLALRPDFLGWLDAPQGRSNPNDPALRANTPVISTPTWTSVLSPSATETVVVAASATCSGTPSVTPSASETIGDSATPSLSATHSGTVSPTISVTPSRSPSATPSPSFTVTPSVSETPYAGTPTPSPTFEPCSDSADPADDAYPGATTLTGGYLLGTGSKVGCVGGQDPGDWIKIYNSSWGAAIYPSNASMGGSASGLLIIECYGISPSTTPGQVVTVDLNSFYGMPSVGNVGWGTDYQYVRILALSPTTYTLSFWFEGPTITPTATVSRTASPSPTPTPTP